MLPRFVFVEGSDDEFSRRVDFEGVSFLVEWEEMIECATDEGLCLGCCQSTETDEKREQMEKTIFHGEGRVGCYG